MTCIITYRDGKNIWMGSDSLGSNGYTGLHRKDSKVFTKKDFVIGYTSSFRMGQLLKWKFEIPEHKSNIPIEKYMNTVFIDSVIKCFDENGYTRIESNKKSGGVFVVGYKKRIFEIQSDFQIAEHYKNYSCIGSGSDVAHGSMFALLKHNKMKPEKMIETSIKVAIDIILSVGGKIKTIKI